MDFPIKNDEFPIKGYFESSYSAILTLRSWETPTVAPSLPISVKIGRSSNPHPLAFPVCNSTWVSQNTVEIEALDVALKTKWGMKPSEYIYIYIILLLLLLLLSCDMNINYYYWSYYYWLLCHYILSYHIILHYIISYYNLLYSYIIWYYIIWY